MATSGASLPQILDGLETAIDDLMRLPGSATPEELRQSAEVALSWIRSLNQELPPGLKRRPFRELQKHMRFVEVYLGRNDPAMVRSNIRSLKPEMVKLRALCAGTLPNPTADLGLNLDELGPGPYKPLLVDACRSFRAEAYPAAVVAAVCSLEGLYRDLYRRKTGKDPARVEFKRVIDELDDGGHLKGLEEPLLQIAGVYRNFSAHPSGLSVNPDEARTLIRFAFSKLRARK